jgi:hypothetical protein
MSIDWHQGTMTYPYKSHEQLKAPPYSDFDMAGLNIERASAKVYCQYCKYTTTVSIYGSKCGQCHSFLITILPVSNVQLAD